MRLPRLLRIPCRAARADVDDELRFHIDMAAADLVARGIAPDAARAEAERRFGAVADIRDACLTIDERRRRATATADRLTAFLQDLAFAVRSLGKTPMLTITSSLTLMLGVGATTAMFSVVNGVLLRPLPYANADRLVALKDDDGPSTSIAYPEFVDWQQRGGQVFESIGAWWNSRLTLTGNGDPVTLRGQRMSASVPDLLGVKPVLGRAFLPEDDGIASPRAVMISSQLWRGRFGGDSSIIGRTVQLSGFPFVVVGVYPSGPQSRLPNELTVPSYSDFWQALRLNEESAPRSLRFLKSIARVRPGLSREVVSARMKQVSDQLIADSVTTHGFVAVDLTAQLSGASRGLAAIFGAVVLVLLVACANVANLLLARATGRQREIAIRAALGAGRRRIVTQLLTESVLRALIGGLLGVGLAYGILRLLQQSLSVRVPRFADVSIDPVVLAFALGLSLLTGIAFGLLPAVRAASADPNSVMREGGRGVAGSLRRDIVRRSLVVGELVMSFVLLAGAGLLLLSFHRLLSVPKGFRPDHVLTAVINLPRTSYPDSVREVNFYNQLLARVRAIPGVTSAAMSSDVPTQGGTNGGTSIEGRTFPRDKAPISEKRFASVDYFRTIGAHIVAGRNFEETDRITRPHVMIVNEAFAREFFPGESPIGKRVGFNWETTGFQTIVGVVTDFKELGLNEAVPPAMYMPMTQRSSTSMFLVVRSSVAELSLVPAIRRELSALDNQLPLDRVRSFDDVIGEGVADQRLATSLLSGFSIVALVLAAIGLYGVISYSVSQRTQELGIRTALGAQRSDILGGIFREGMTYVAAGVVLGATVARGAAQVISSQLYGVTAGEPTVYLVVAAVLGLVSAFALAFPALRAARVDPIIALREE
jgi:predicted permease